MTWLRAAIAGILVSLLLVGYVAYYFPVNDPYHPLNTGWNGCSQIYQMAQRRNLLDSYAHGTPTLPSLLTIIGPRIRFGMAEAQVLLAFLTSGGTVLLADDFGTGNTLLEDLNISTRFAGKPLADLYFYSKSPSFPAISDFNSSLITRNVTTVVMDHPTYLQIPDPTNVRVLAFSSPFSFIDALNNGTLPPNAITQSYPVMADITIGRGKLVLVSNSYVFTNEMIPLLSNRLLFSNLLTLTNQTMTFDLAHIQTAPLTDLRVSFKNQFDVWMGSLRSTISEALLTGTLVALFAGAFFQRRGQRRTTIAVLAESTLHTNQR